MTNVLTRRATLSLVPLLLWLLASSAVRAEGEAGLVVDFGNGNVFTFCAAFPGDDITGEALLRSAGMDVNQFSGLVCSIQGTGCTHSGSFDSCTCECKSGSGSCTSWSFFSQKYGASWVYSALGFRASAAKNGDLHAWKWGSGSVSSAPPPASYTFEQVCGHAPETPNEATPGPTISFFPPTATPDTPVQRPSTPAPANTNAPTVAPGATSTAPASTVPPTTAGFTPAPPNAGSGISTPGAQTPSNQLPQTMVTLTVLPPSAGDEDAGSGDDGGGVNMGLVMFGAVAVVLAGAIGGAMLRGRRS